MKPIFSNTTAVNDLMIQRFSYNCPLLEKLTTYNNHDNGIELCGKAMRYSNNLKQINMDSILINCHAYNQVHDKIADLEQSSRDISIPSMLQGSWTCFDSKRQTSLTFS
jgi:hypothetical protein